MIRPLKSRPLDQAGIGHLFFIIIAAIVLIAIFTTGYHMHRHTQTENDRKQTSGNPDDMQTLGQSFTAKVIEPYFLKDGDQVIKFRFSKLQDADGGAECIELCESMMTKIITELTYNNHTVTGSVSMPPSLAEMSSSQNGAYNLIPYTIRVNDVDFKKQTGTVKITRQNTQNVELGKPFTIRSGEIALLEPDKTGVVLYFGTCGINSPCIRDLSTYINGKSVSGSTTDFQAEKPPKELQYASVDGSVVESDGIRLRLIESDDATYAMLVFEKAN